MDYVCVVVVESYCDDYEFVWYWDYLLADDMGSYFMLLGFVPLFLSEKLLKIGCPLL